MPLPEILKELPTLSSEDLKNIQNKIKFLLDSNKKHPAKIVHKIEEQVLTGIAQQARNAILVHAKKYTDVPLHKQLLENPHRITSKLNVIAYEIESMSKSMDLNKIEINNLCRALVSAAVLKLEETQKPVSFRLMIYMMSDPKSLMHESWPGYAGTKLFKGVVLNGK